MSRVVIIQPVINSPFEEPRRHYLFDDQGITNIVLPGRRPSSYFVPIAKPRSSKSGGQQVIEDWTGDRIEENPTVIQIRSALQRWRRGRYTADTTRISAVFSSGVGRRQCAGGCPGAEMKGGQCLPEISA